MPGALMRPTWSISAELNSLACSSLYIEDAALLPTPKIAFVWAIYNQEDTGWKGGSRKSIYRFCILALYFGHRCFSSQKLAINCVSAVLWIQEWRGPGTRPPSSAFLNEPQFCYREGSGKGGCMEAPAFVFKVFLQVFKQGRILWNCKRSRIEQPKLFLDWDRSLLGEVTAFGALLFILEKR